MGDPVSKLAQLLKASRRIFVFTGAGISTGSGIPDFRGPRGTWKTRQPVYFEDFLASEDARIEHWDYKLEGWEAFRAAKPNAAHKAVAALEKMGRLELLATQNIDGLHQQAGNSPGMVVELHGTNREVECLSCGARSLPEPAFAFFKAARRCPRCPEPCGGLLKTATISFGQPMPRGPLDRAFAAARRADLVMAIGSTLTVEPAASLPLAGKQNGAPYVIVNQGETAHDGLASLRIEGDAAEILPQAVALIS